MANSIDISKNALRRFQAYRGGKPSTYLWCQALAYWWVTAARGGESGLRTYPTAKAAAKASTMFTRSINDANLTPGDMLFWDWSTDGHVAVVVGRRNGRTLVVHTGASGSDTVLDLGYSYKVSHADSIRLSFIGASHRNGSNPRVSATPWPNTPREPHERRVTSGGPANGRKEPSTSSPVVQQIPGGDYGEFDGWIYGESVSGNKVWYRGKFSKNWFWSGSFTSTSTSGLTNLNPKKPTDPTKRTTSDIVRVRQKPTTASAHLKTYDAGTTHTINGWKNGEAVEGIKEWFRTVDGWVWSDGFTNRSTKGLKDLNDTPSPTPDPPAPKPNPSEFTPKIVTPSAKDFPKWIRYEEKLKPGITTQRNVEDAEYYGMKYNPVESHTHWWGTPGQAGTHDSNVSYLNGSADVDTNYVTSPGRITLSVPLNIIAYTTGRRNPYGWKSENDPSLTELGYKTLAYLHYIVEKLNPALANEPVRLHKEFTATACSNIDVKKVRDYANKFKSGEWDPATGEPKPAPAPDPKPEPEPQPVPDYDELVKALNRTSDKLDVLNAKLDSIYKI